MSAQKLGGFVFISRLELHELPIPYEEAVERIHAVLKESANSVGVTSPVINQFCPMNLDGVVFVWGTNSIDSVRELNGLKDLRRSLQAPL